MQPTHPQDLVKPLTHKWFGPGHFIADPAQNYQTLLGEWKMLEELRQTGFTAIGNGFCQFHLGNIKTIWELKALHRFFLAAAKHAPNDRKAFRQEVVSLSSAHPEHEAWFISYLERYDRDGTFLVSHSEKYRNTYHPAYRVILEKYVPYLPLCALIEQKLETGRVVVGIDGRCGSGKSTHALILSELYDAPVLPMDDFFLPKALRTPERLAEPGGNVHYERFLKEIEEDLVKGNPVVYRPFDCGTMDFAQSRTVEPAPVTICEGTYSLHPKLRHLYQIRVFSTCPPEVQKARLLEREGAEKAERFAREWIPLEEKYFSTCGTEEFCDITLKIH